MEKEEGKNICSRLSIKSEVPAGCNYFLFFGVALYECGRRGGRGQGPVASEAISVH